MLGSYGKSAYINFLFDGDYIVVQKDFKSPSGSVTHDAGALLRVSMPAGSFQFLHLILVIKIKYATVELHLDVGSIDAPIGANEHFRKFFGHFYGATERLDIRIGYDFAVRHMIERTAAKVIDHHHTAHHPAAGTE